MTAQDISRIVQEIYAPVAWPRRLMLRARPYICPFEELIARVPEGVSVLDVGCGDGLFLNVMDRAGRISSALGFDTSRRALAAAVEVRSRLGGGQRVEFIEWSVGQPWPSGLFDVVSMVDVLHHIPVSGKEHAIREAAAHVKPGGIFLFKDIGITPSWRAFFNSLHDFVLTGEVVTYTPIAVVIGWAESAGMTAIEERTINRLWYGHQLVVLSKVAAHDDSSEAAPRG